jgi:hypothetical protein
VKERLGLARGESLSTTAARREFDKLEEFTADSSCTVSTGTGGTSENRLMIYLAHEEVQRLS